MIAAVYARKSTDQNGVADEERSVTRQVENARAYAESKGWTVADEHVYVDDGISGAEFANRPAFLRLMTALKPNNPRQRSLRRRHPTFLLTARSLAIGGEIALRSRAGDRGVGSRARPSTVSQP